jgi:lysozyme
MDIVRLREQLKHDEGCKYEIYKDQFGYLTFGIGHLVTQNDPEWGQAVDTPVTEERVNEAFNNDVQKTISETKILFPNLESMPEDAQQVLVNMCYNMGRPRLSQFHHFISYINQANYEQASFEMLDSAWAKQVPNRANRLSLLLRNILA